MEKAKSCTKVQFAWEDNEIEISCSHPPNVDENEQRNEKAAESNPKKGDFTDRVVKATGIPAHVILLANMQVVIDAQKK